MCECFSYHRAKLNFRLKFIVSYWDGLGRGKMTEKELRNLLECLARVWARIWSACGGETLMDFFREKGRREIGSLESDCLGKHFDAITTRLPLWFNLQKVTLNLHVPVWKVEVHCVPTALLWISHCAVVPSVINGQIKQWHCRRWFFCWTHNKETRRESWGKCAITIKLKEY